MSKLLAMFPGQGSQYVGMGRDLLARFPYTGAIFEEAEEATKAPIRQLCFDGPDDALKLTANTQPCILTVSVAAWRVLVQEKGIKPDFFAGHSLGEYSALVAAGKLSLGRAAFLVRRRGEAMQRAVPEGVGAMAAVMNLPAADLEAKAQACSKPGDVVEVVNYNSPQQLVVAGHKGAVERLVKELEAIKIRSVMLPVSAPFHSSLMLKAREDMAPLLNETKFESNDTQVIANISGRVEQPYTAKLLIEQINGAVRWTQTLETAVAAGCTAFTEVGPGKVLMGLARRTLPKDAVLQTSEDLTKPLPPSF